MPKYSIYVLIAATLCLSACASQHTAKNQPVRKTTVIVVAKNGEVSVDHKTVKLHSLVSTLKAHGINKNTKLAVEGDPGADQKTIEHVLETLVDGGLLPKGTID